MNNTLEGLKQNRKALEESIAYRQKAAQDAGTTAYDIGTTEEKERLGKINAEIEKLSARSETDADRNPSHPGQIR